MPAAGSSAPWHGSPPGRENGDKIVLNQGILELGTQTTVRLVGDAQHKEGDRFPSEDSGQDRFPKSAHAGLGPQLCCISAVLCHLISQARLRKFRIGAPGSLRLRLDNLGIIEYDPPQGDKALAPLAVDWMMPFSV